MAIYEIKKLTYIILYQLLLAKIEPIPETCIFRIDNSGVQISHQKMANQ